MSPDNEHCPRCGTELRGGATFCHACSTPVGRLSGPRRATQPGQHPGPQPGQQAAGGIIPVSPDGARQPMYFDPRGRDDDVATNLTLVPGPVGKRFGAKVIDLLPPGILMGLFAIIGMLTITPIVTAGVLTGVNISWMLILIGIGSLLSLAYWVLIWAWESKTGKTPGNAMVGLRTTGESGQAPGWGATLIRWLILDISGVVPVIGPILVLLSPMWDKGPRLQGWDDKVAKTLVFDVKAGRDPLTSGGVHGPQTFAPEPMQPVQRVNSPLPGAATPPVQPAQPVQAPAQPPQAPAQPVQAPRPQDQPAPSEPAQAPARESARADDGVISSVPSFAPVQQPAPGAQDGVEQATPTALEPEPEPAQEPVETDDDLEQTRVTDRGSASTRTIEIVFDNGQRCTIESTALIGRNPSGHDGEVIDQLIGYADEGRSVSKTHLHVSVDGAGVWVTDRRSTNGSAVSGSGSGPVKLRPGEPVHAGIGSTVRFGDRSFVVGAA